MSYPRSISSPDGCPIPTWRVTTFNWYNGYSSLDCIHNEADINAKGCLQRMVQTRPSNLQRNDGERLLDGDANVPSMGLRASHTLDIVFADGLKCHDEHIGYRVHDIGHGESNCGYADRGEGRIVAFHGTSNLASSVGHMDYTLGDGHAHKRANGNSITYSESVDFPLTCTHDRFFNATCIAPVFEIPVVYKWVS